MHYSSSEELADILLYLVRLADKLEVDLPEAALHKLEKNALKYPADQVRGNAKKYSDLHSSSSDEQRILPDNCQQTLLPKPNISHLDIS